MMYKFEYKSEEEKLALIVTHGDKYLVEEQNIIEGKFLVFANDLPKVYLSVPEEEFDTLKQENTLLKAQSQANSDRADFHEEVLAEIILAINP